MHVSLTNWTKPHSHTHKQAWTKWADSRCSSKPKNHDKNACVQNREKSKATPFFNEHKNKKPFWLHIYTHIMTTIKATKRLLKLQDGDGFLSLVWYCKQ